MTLKRIAALLGALLLITLYVSTLVLALMHNPVSTSFLMASILATFFIPVTIYGMTLIANILKKDNGEK